MSDTHGEDHQDRNGAQPMSSPAGGPGALPPSGGKDILRNPLVLVLAVVIIIAAVVGAYFLGSSHGTGGTAGTSGAAGSASGTRTAAELSARGVCEATLDRVKDFGIVEPDTALTSNDAEKTSVPNRVICTAKSPVTTYKITVDQLCNDMGQNKCLQLWNVTDASGKTLFQHREFLPPQE